MLFLRHEGCAWCYSTRMMFIIMVTFKILVSYFICVATAKTLSVSWHWLTLENIFHMNTSLCCRFLSSLLFHCHCCWCFRLKSSYLHRWMQFQAPDRMVAVYVYISGILSLSLSEDEDCSLEDILLTKSYKTVVSEIVFARKLRHAYF